MTTVGPIPDGTNWVDAYGRTWTAEGDGLVLWSLPVITLIGDDPQRIIEGEPWSDPGATAVQADGTDITNDIVVDSSGLDVDVPGSYPVSYTVTDSEGYEDQVFREVIVVSVHRPDVRDIIYDLIAPAMPDGVQVYRTPSPQVKAPAIVVGTASWTPRSMNSLEFVEWEIDIRIMTQRSAPEYYSVFSLETLSLKAATLLLEPGFRVVGFTDEGMIEHGGQEYLSGTLGIIYKQTKEG